MAEILMGERAATLDCIARVKIKDLRLELKAECAIAIVTHSMQRAAQVSRETGFL